MQEEIDAKESLQKFIQHDICFVELWNISKI